MSGLLRSGMKLTVVSRSPKALNVFLTYTHLKRCLVLENTRHNDSAHP